MVVSSSGRSEKTFARCARVLSKPSILVLGRRIPCEPVATGFTTARQFASLPLPQRNRSRERDGSSFAEC